MIDPVQDWTLLVHSGIGCSVLEYRTQLVAGLTHSGTSFAVEFTNVDTG